MGNNHPQFNVTSLSYIVCTTQQDLLRVLHLHNDKSKNSQFEEDAETGEAKMKVSKDGFNEILIEADIHESGSALSC
jgi:hypothetical protein